ncbi:MAG: FAD-dependent oxidoreductase [Ruminococcaceae bacterium]|nr:FAD-dependent oxidoreductase [Oscillospiraceae bacterium]
MKTKYDLIVVGGGFAGVSSAIQAAKNGLDVLLIEKYNCLGGAASNALVMPFMKYWTNDAETKEKKYLCGNLFLEIIDEMRKESGTEKDLGVNDISFDEEILKLILNRMCIKYGVTLLFNTTVTKTDVSDKKICSITAFGKSMELKLFADTFIDATGDGELSYLAGCKYILGREKDNLCQPMTLCFRLSGVDKKKFLENRHKINPLYKEFKQKGLIKNVREDVLIFSNFNDGVLHFNSTRIVKKNPTDPFEITQSEIEAREQVFELHNFLKENIEGFENSRVLSTALLIGIRESRKIVGEYTLCENDLKSLARFNDAIAVANYDIDIHNPEGEGTSHFFFGDGKWYQIPYRCLIPKNMDNLLVAGRCISSTHEAQASYRIMPYCAEIGQAAGVAAYVAKKDNKDVRYADIEKIQKILRNEGFMI